MTHPAAGPRIDHTTQHRHLGNKAVPPGGAIPVLRNPVDTAIPMGDPPIPTMMRWRAVGHWDNRSRGPGMRHQRLEDACYGFVVSAIRCRSLGNSHSV
jgi:hypothetical protein